MLSPKETLCRAIFPGGKKPTLSRLKNSKNSDFVLNFRCSGIVKHTDFRFLVVKKNILLQKIRKNDAICSIYILQTLISREKGRADIENEF